MKTELFGLVALTAVLLAGSCSYDDTALKDRVGSLEVKVTALEQTVTQMNTNLRALQETLDVLVSGDYIKDVTEITAGDDVIGYTITFGRHAPVTIYNGEDGRNGSTPSIGVTLGSDGRYYWMVNGEILKDADGKEVSAAGVTPLLRIDDGIWQYSVDNGTNWENVIVEGYSGVVFKAVEEKEYSVTIELADGTVLEIPKMGNFDIVFSSPSYYVVNDAEYSVDYTIEGADEQTVVVVFPSGDVTASVVRESASAGTVNVVKGKESSSAQIMVVAGNGRGQKDYEILNFNELEFTITAADLGFEIAGGTANIEMTSNVDYEIRLSENVSWLTWELADSENSDSKVLTVTLVENPLRMVRTVSIEIVDRYGYVIQEVVVAQAAAEYTAGGSMGDINILPA